MTLAELRARLKEKTGALPAIEAKGLAADATVEDTQALEKAVADIEALDGQIKLAERAEKARAISSLPADQVAPPATVPAAVEKELPFPEMVGMVLQGLVKGHSDGHGRGLIAGHKGLEAMGYAGLSQKLGAFQKAATSPNSAGGFLIPDNFNDQVIEFLNPVTAFLRGGPMTMPMPTGSYRQPGQASQPTASYRGEAATIASSDLTFREINMSAKLLSSMVPVTNQIVARSSTAMIPFVQRSMATVMGLKMDEQALVGTGIQAGPLGVLRIGGHFSTPATNATAPTAAQIDADTRKLLNRLALFPILQVGLHWIMAQRTFGYLQDMRNTDGSFTYPQLQSASPTFKGYPVLVSAVIPTNGGGATDESEIALVSFGSIMLGITKAMELSVSTEATVGGVNMFETDQTAIRATSEHDWETRYTEAILRLTAVKWGA